MKAEPMQGTAIAKGRADMKTNEEWARMMEEHEIVYLRADICLGSPGSYSLDEKRKSVRTCDAANAL